MNIREITLSTALVVSMAIVMAPMAAQAQTVNQRLNNQQKRIRQGDRSGQLTRKENRQVRAKERVMKAQEHLDRVDHNGHLTGKERGQLNRELNRTGKQIYRDKHNNKVRG